MLADKLLTRGHAVKSFRAPDGESDSTLQAIRQITQDPKYPINSRTELLLYNAARSQSLAIINRQLHNGVICLSDRNYLSTIAVQYYARRSVDDYDFINQVTAFASAEVEPDLVIVLDAPVDVLMSRQKQRGESERFDQLSEQFLNDIRRGYSWEAQQRGYPVVVATGEPEQVFDEIWKLVEPVLRSSSEDSEPEPIAKILKSKRITKKVSKPAAKPKSKKPEAKTSKSKSKSRRRNRSKKS
jgi:dTMP kinase